MLRKVLPVIMVVAILFTLFGCKVDNTPTVGTSSEVTKLEGNIELFIQGDGGDEAFYPAIIAKFNEDYPDVEFEINYDPKASETIKLRLLSADAPDFVYAWHVVFDYASAYKQGLLYAVDEIFAQQTLEGDMKLSEKLNSVLQDEGLYEGKRYILPTGQMLYCSFYNAKFFRDSGYEMADNWADFLALCEEIKNDGVAPIIFTGVYPEGLGNNMILAEINNNDPATLQRIYDGDSTAWNAPATLKAVTRLENLVKAGYVDKTALPIDHIQSQLKFINNDAAMITVGSWLEGEMSGSWPADFELQPFVIPSEDGTRLSYLVNPGEVALPKNDKNPENFAIMKEFMRYFYSDEITLLGTEINVILPAFQVLTDELFNLAGKSTKAAFELVDEKNVNLVLPQIEIKYGALMPEYYNNINALVAGAITAEEFCDNMEQAMEEVMNP